MAEASGSASQEVPEGYKVLQEGQGRVLLKGNDVFYNEAQVTNRDLSVAVLRMFVPQLQEELKGKLKKKRHKSLQELGPLAPAQQEDKQTGVRILEGLAASGLRSIRYAMEVDGISQVDANDLDAAVVESMQRNIAFNGPDVAAKVRALNSDARLTMLQNPLQYDVVDLDPYGTPAFLLDSAVQAVADGGLLMVTATDMAVLCGNTGEVCWTKYGSYPLHRPFCHEMALRILLQSIEGHANRYKRTITPLLSLSVDFYIRVFVRIHTSAADMKDSASKLAYVYQSQGCDAWALQRVGDRVQRGNSVKYTPGHGPPVDKRCTETGAGFLVGGPIWAEPIHDRAWVSSLLQELEADKARYAAFGKIKGLLSSVVEELEDVPLYYNIHDVCKTVHATAPKSEVFKSALLNAGYRVSGSHACPLAMKTDAPSSVVWDIVRCWVKEHPIVRKLDENSYAGKLLAKEPEMEADFKHNPEAASKSKAAGTARFVQNPAFWGPKARHGRPEVEHKGKGKQQKQQEQQQEQQEEQQQEDQQDGNQEQAAGTSAQQQVQPQDEEQPQHRQQQGHNQGAQQHAGTNGTVAGAQHSGNNTAAAAAAAAVAAAAAPELDGEPPAKRQKVLEPVST